MTVSVNDPRISSWTYAPAVDDTVERPPVSSPLRTTYHPAAGTVVVTGHLFSNDSGRRVLPTDVSVDDGVLSVQFDELHATDDSNGLGEVVPSTDHARPFSLCVRFEADLPDRTEITYDGPDGQRLSDWPNRATVSADDD